MEGGGTEAEQCSTNGLT